MDYRIVRADSAQLAALASIERAGARMLAAFLDCDVDDSVTALEDLRVACADDRLWVTCIGADPVGFALARDLDGHAHLEEIDVLPSHGRRGIGTALVRTVCGWAERRGDPGVTLTAFRAVPWNMPFYARLGFVEVPELEWGAGLVACVCAETARGLSPLDRVVMRYPCHANRALP